MRNVIEVEAQTEPIRCSVGIMAYNEEANIVQALQAVLAQDTCAVQIAEVIVVASGCTDRTIPRVLKIARTEKRVRLIVQRQREGKASAINVFLEQASCDVVVLLGADVIPAEDALERLCLPLRAPDVGMVGGRPIPVNAPTTCLGHAAHLLWYLHDRLARVEPKLGEIIAFRKVIPAVPVRSAVDEISIQALVAAQGYRLLYQPACVVYNKGPETVQDFVRQRRRIYAGHLWVRAFQDYEASTLRPGPIVRQLLACRRAIWRTPQQACWTVCIVLLEGYARALGASDYLRRREHTIWQMAASTKNLGSREVGRLKPASGITTLL